MSKEILGKECKFVVHIPKVKGVRDDTHVIKETTHYKDGTLESNLRIVRNYKKPFWITKESYQNHNDKKESEDIEKLNKYYTTESDMYGNVAMRLGKGFLGNKTSMVVKSSPYTYGLDVTAKTYIKNQYMTKYKGVVSKHEECVLDIEVDTETDTLIVLSLSTREKIYTIINKSMLLKNIAHDGMTTKQLNKVYKEKLLYLYNKHIPDNTLAKKAKVEYIVVENELEVVLEAFKTLHIWKPDFVAIWNITYDLGKIITILERNNKDLAEVFSDPDLPADCKYFKLKEGQKQKVTESGKFKPVNVEEQWHSYIAPAHFWWVDAMSTHRYIRVGGKTVPGGYSLDNILKQELGEKLGKLKFQDGTAEHLKGLEWHVHMVNKRPLEYIIYNQWDVMSMIELDNKTKDLSVVLPMLSDVSGFEIFNSGPKRIIDAMHFFFLDNNCVLATKPRIAEDFNLLGLSGWITLLPSYRIKDVGTELVAGSGVYTNNRMYTYDSDQVSG